MSARIAYDPEDGVAVFYDSVTGQGFGPVFEGPEANLEAAEFEEWLAGDIRTYTKPQLFDLVNRWRKDVKGEELQELRL